MSREVRTKVLVVGAGVAGLGAALELERGGTDVLVVDEGDAPGGVMRTDSVRGFRIERGPNTIRIDAGLQQLLVDQDLVTLPLRATAENKSRWLFAGGKLVRVPTSLVSMFRSKLLGPAAKRRALREPLIQRGDASRESVAAFVTRRLGSEVAENLVAPFLTGVYAGDPERLGAEAVLPSLVDAERRRGSILLGSLTAAIRNRLGNVPRGRPGIWSCVSGLSELAASLSAGLALRPRLATRVEAIARDREGWRTEVRGPEGETVVRSRGLLLAMPADAAARLTGAVDAELAARLASIEYAPIVTLALGVEPGGVQRSIEGFGFLVPAAARMDLLGCLFMSRLFPDRAPPGAELLHCILGGVRAPDVVTLPEDLLRKRCLGELDRVLGLRAEPTSLKLTRWPKAVAQPGVRHRELDAAIDRRLTDLPGLGLAGAYRSGVSVAAALASGVAQARIISARLSTQ